MFDASASWWTQGMSAALMPGLSAAVAGAIGRYGHVLFPRNVHDPALDLADAMLSHPSHSGYSRAFFSDDGSTAVEVALKMAFREFLVDRGLLGAKRAAVGVGIDLDRRARPPVPPTPHALLRSFARSWAWKGPTTATPSAPWTPSRRASSPSSRRRGRRRGASCFESVLEGSNGIGGGDRARMRGRGSSEDARVPSRSTAGAKLANPFGSPP